MFYGDIWLGFTYDANGKPIAVNYSGSNYYYALNLQGDVVAILNNSGVAVARYTYDAWGRHLSISGSMASTLGQYNPFRYRGYVYDSETGLYYLQSRYYNPTIGRFINADDPGYLGADGTVISYNLFAYCGNNPVMGYDPGGMLDWGVIIDWGINVFATIIGIGAGTANAAKGIFGDSRTAIADGVSAGVAVFGAINNTVNSLYYEISDKGSELTNDSYTQGYLSRWDRLDYTKQQTGEDSYNLNAWRYYSEYSVHMYGWYATSWAYKQDYGIISQWAYNFREADVAANDWDSRWFVNVATTIWGTLGM